MMWLRHLWYGSDWTTWLSHGVIAGLATVAFIVYPWLAPFAPALFYLFREIEQVIVFWPINLWTDHVLDVVAPLMVCLLVQFLFSL